MKKMKFGKTIASLIVEKILLLILLLAGVYFTDLALDGELWKQPALHIPILIAAVILDTSFFLLLRKVLRRKVIPALKNTVRKVFSSLYRRIGSITKKLSQRNRSGKIFVDGKEERSFTVEARERKSVRTRKRLPKLSKDASEREKARHAYTTFVFKRDKDIPSVLTPSEVAVRLDEKGENRDIFHNYNFARYSKEEKEI